MNASEEAATVIGQTYGREPNRLFGIKATDRLHHVTIFGQTGTGKSTLLTQMMRQDIKSGQGFGLLDPHGDLAKTVHADADEKCIYWDLADPGCPYGYNPLTFTRPKYRPLIASGLIDALKKQWADAWGARMEHLADRVALVTGASSSHFWLCWIVQDLV